MSSSVLRSGLSDVRGKSYPRELPAHMRREEITIAGPNVRLRSRTRSPAQHVLIAHKLPVVFTDGSRRELETRIRGVGTLRPLPRIAVHLIQFPALGLTFLAVNEIASDRQSFCCNLPLCFRRQPAASPSRVSVR